MKQAIQKKETSLQKTSFIAQESALTSIKGELRKAKREIAQTDASKAFVVKYTLDLIGDYRILAENFLKLKKALIESMKNTDCLIESGKFWRERNEALEKSFDELCIDYNLLNDSLQENNFKKKNHIKSTKSFSKVVKM